MANGYVRVRINARQQVRYDQVITMLRATWDQLKACDDEQEAADLVTDYLDLGDVFDADPVDSFEARLVDENGATIKGEEPVELN